MVGERYCMNPIQLRGMTLTALENSSNGKKVSMPPQMSRRAEERL